MTTEIFEERTTQGHKVLAESNGNELYCTVKNPDGSLNIELCGWYRTNDFKLAVENIERHIECPAA